MAQASNGTPPPPPNQNVGPKRVEPTPSEVEDLSSSGLIIFPSNLNDPKGKYPCVIFSTRYEKEKGNGQLSIALPIPPSIGFSAGGDYETLNISDPSKANAILAGLGSSDKAAKIGSMIGEKVLNKAEEFSPGAKSAVQFGTKKIVNPNTNTTFKGNTLRSFNFSFSLIASSPAETLSIHRIRKTFQRFVYAGPGVKGGYAILSYPPVWRIRFYDGTTTENSWYPRIFSCYLTDVQFNVNPEGNLFRPDGSPHEITMDLSFRETRVLTRKDIDEMEQGVSSRGIDPESGLASY